MKKIICFLLALMLVVQIMPALEVSAAGDIVGAEKSISVDEKINELVQIFNAGEKSGEYFTTDGKSCSTHHGNGGAMSRCSKCGESGMSYCANCRLSHIIKSDYIKNLLKGKVPSSYTQCPTIYYNRTGYEGDCHTCIAFARYAGWYLYAKNNKDTVEYERIAINGDNSYEFSKENFEAANAQPGDIIVFDAGTYDHATILVSYSSSGATLLDCNLFTNGVTQVRKHTKSYGFWGKMTVNKIKCEHKEYEYNAEEQAALCTNCNQKYPIPEPNGSVRGRYKGMQFFVYNQPYSEAAKTFVGINSTFDVTGTVENAFDKTWYKSDQGYFKSMNWLTRIGDIPTNLTYSNINMPGSLKEGDNYWFNGKIKSTDALISKVTAILVSSDGSQSKWGTATINSYTCQLENVDKRDFAKLKPGNYIMRIKTETSNGGVDTKDYPFTVEKKTGTVAEPTITISQIDGGVRFKLECSDKKATVHYTVNGKEQNPFIASSSKTLEYRTVDSYKIEAYTTKTGCNDSRTVSTAYTVSKAAAPSISDVVYSGDSARITIKGDGVVYYTLDGSTPGAGSAKCSGSVEINESCTVKAMCASQSGKAASEVTEKTITLSKPDAPALTVDKAKIARGETVSVSWNNVPRAGSYTARLYAADGGEPIQEEIITGSRVGFKPDEPGAYIVTVSAGNVAGESAAASSESISVMPDVTVRFWGYEENETGEELKTEVGSQTVRYGAVPAAPSIPPREGYTFSGWDGMVNSPVYEDTDFTAQYQINRYTVRFCEADGTTIDSRRVEYKGAAVPPEVTPPENYEGYTFAGWCVENKSEGLDYNCVKADMTLTASYRWENMDLPVEVKIESAVYKEGDDRKPYYACSVNIKNNNEAFTRGRLVATVQTSEGRTVATHVEDISIKPAENMTEFSDSFDFIINSTEVGTKLAVVVLGVDENNDDKTGGTYSKMVTGNITAEVTYGEWSEWSTELPPDDALVETKTQYSYRSKIYKTSTSALGSPWVYEKELEPTYGEWSGWSRTKVTASDTLEVQTRTVNVPAVTKTQYRYFRYSGYKKSNGAWWYYFCPNTANSNLQSPKLQEMWLDKLIAKNSRSVQSCSCHGKYYFIDYGNTEYLAKYPTPETRQVVVTPASSYIEYRSRPITHNYSYSAWGEWSEWKDTAPSDYKSSYDEVETRTLYQFREKTVGQDPVESEIKGEAYEVSGRISVGADESLENKHATVLVYKKTNTDPTQSQLEYVNQILLGEDGSYAFSVKPKDALNAETGDFVVAIALEGATRLVNAYVIEAPRAEHTVTFYMNGEQIGEPQKVVEGACAVIPTDIEVPEGYILKGWDESVSNISEDLKIDAILEPETFTVTFVDWENSNITMTKAKYNDGIPYPEEPAAPGRKFIRWECETGEYAVTGDMMLEAVWDFESYMVDFLDGQGNSIDQQTVIFGEAAELPEIEVGTVMGDYIFAGWSNDSRWWNVTEDTMVLPILLSENTLVAPMASIADGTETAPTYLELYASNENARVYYSMYNEITEDDIDSFFDENYIEQGARLMSAEEYVSPAAEDGEEPVYTGEYGAAEILEYTEPILLSESCVIYTFQRTEDGTVSDIASYLYFVNTDGEEIMVKAGDINRDGVVDTADIVRLMNYLVGKETSLDYFNADTNKDEEISVVDALRLMKYLAGWEVTVD